MSLLENQKNIHTPIYSILFYYWPNLAHKYTHTSVDSRCDISCCVQFGYFELSFGAEQSAAIVVSLGEFLGPNRPQNRREPIVASPKRSQLSIYLDSNGFVWRRQLNAEAWTLNKAHKTGRDSTYVTLVAPTRWLAGSLARWNLSTNRASLTKQPASQITRQISKQNQWQNR